MNNDADNYFDEEYLPDDKRKPPAVAPKRFEPDRAAENAMRNNTRVTAEEIEADILRLFGAKPPPARNGR